MKDYLTNCRAFMRSHRPIIHGSTLAVIALVAILDLPHIDFFWLGFSGITELDA